LALEATSYFKTSSKAQSSDFAEASTGQAALDRGGQSSKSRQRRDYCGCPPRSAPARSPGSRDLILNLIEGFEIACKVFLSCW